MVLKPIDQKTNSKVSFRISKNFIRLFMIQNVLGVIIVLLFLELLLYFLSSLSSYILIIGALFIIVSLIDVLLYRRLSSIEYKVENGKFLVKKGKLIKKTSLIFIQKIYAIEKVTNPVNDKMDLLTIKIRLVNKDIEIYGLRKADAELLILLLESQKNDSQDIQIHSNL